MGQPNVVSPPLQIPSPHFAQMPQSVWQLPQFSPISRLHTPLPQ
jgi:hypothetical protein